LGYRAFASFAFTGRFVVDGRCKTIERHGFVNSSGHARSHAEPMGDFQWFSREGHTGVHNYGRCGRHRLYDVFLWAGQWLRLGSDMTKMKRGPAQVFS